MYKHTDSKAAFISATEIRMKLRSSNEEGGINSIGVLLKGKGIMSELCLFFIFFFIFLLLFICAYKAWFISPPCPHPLPELCLERPP
jgi:hypothetical protein